MSTVALLLWTGALFIGTAIIALVLVRRTGPGRSPVVETAAPLPPQQETAERADRLRSLLLTRMSHDLRTPLNSVITLSQLLAEGNAGALSNEQRRYVDVIHRNGQALLALINDILDLSAVESGRVELDFGLVDLSALARTVADACAPAAREKGIPLSVSLPSPAAEGRPRVLVRADEQRLAQVVHHLVDYAISETRNGYVEVQVGAAAGEPAQARIRIHDTAEGLPEAARRALADNPQDLDPFIVGEGGFAEPPPVSLPLLLAARLAKLMDLRIGVQSSASDGVSFEITLPLVTEASPVARPDGPPSREVDGDRADGVPIARASGNVLVIEDDVYERRRVGGIIESLGYRVTLASSGDEGLSLLRDGHFDAVVLDLVMPGMSGLDVLRAARTEQPLGDVPFIVLSALYMTKGERAVLGPKVTDVVRKGDTTTEELEGALRRAIAHATGVGRATGDDGGGYHAPAHK